MEPLGALCSSALLLCCASLVCAAVPGPQNVTLHTLNTNYLLKWVWDADQVQDGARNITFTVQYLAKFKLKKPKREQDWKSLCESTPERECDFSSAKLHYLGVWLLRLRAQNGRNVSSWVKKEFCPDREASIGPPSAVNVTPVKGLLQIVISDPLTFDNGSMKEWLPNMYYYIEYWRQSASTPQPNNLTSPNNLVILPALDNWTRYCVRVRCMDDYYKKSSIFSPTYCIQTDGQTPYWQIVLSFLLSMGPSFMVFMGIFVCIYRVGKMVEDTFFPLIPLPAPILEYLCDLSSSKTLHLLPSEPELDICSDKLELLTSQCEVTEIILEVHLPPETSQQSGRAHSRQSSCDSGVYSTEGSGPRQNELVGLKVEKPGKNIRGVEELDEGVQDVIV